MAATKATTRRGTGFDVVCSIGRVEFGDTGVHPEIAAFQLIAEHGTQGVFTFPREDGSTCVVTVEHESTVESELAKMHRENGMTR